jgi:hypothetical protein
MSSNELYSRKSRFSDRDYENSSLCNRSIKSDLNSLSVELPHKRKKQNSIEREIVQRQPQKMSVTINLTSKTIDKQTRNIRSYRKCVPATNSTGKLKILGKVGIGASNGVILGSPTKCCRKCTICKESITFQGWE